MYHENHLIFMNKFIDDRNNYPTTPELFQQILIANTYIIDPDYEPLEVSVSQITSSQDIDSCIELSFLMSDKLRVVFPEKSDEEERVNEVKIKFYGNNQRYTLTAGLEFIINSLKKMD